MGGKCASAGNIGRPEPSWPEKAGRVPVVLAIVVLMVGTPLASVLTLSKHIEEQTVTVIPGSYYVVHLGIYGYGTYDLSWDCHVGDEGYLLGLDRLNFWLFKSGYDYDYMRYSRISGSGGGGSGGGGPFWETYYVFVNSGRYNMEITVSLDSNAYFSLPFALLLLGGMAALVYAHANRTERMRTAEREPLLAMKSRSERRKAIIAMTWVSALVAGTTVGLGLLTSLNDTSGFLAGVLVFFRIWLSTIIGVIIIFKFGRRLQVVKGVPKTTLADLARRLRVSGYMVSERQNILTVRISTTSAIRVFTKPTADGAVVKYRAAATPRGLSVIVFLMLMPYSSFLGFVIALFMLYRSAVFADVRIIPRMHELSRGMSQGIRANTRDMLIDGLSEGRRLSAEAYEAARSNYHDLILLLVAVGIISSAALATLSYGSWFQDLDRPTRLAVSVLSGLVVGLAIPIMGWRVLGRRSKSKVDELRRWTEELERALQLEVSTVQIPDEDSSSFELILESCKVVPEWLRVRRKGRMFRDPVSWVLIFILSLMAFEFALTGIQLLIHDYSALSALILSVSACMTLLVAFIYLRWRRKQAEDDRELKKDLKTRFQNLKKEMEAYLGNV